MNGLTRGRLAAVAAGVVALSLLATACGSTSPKQPSAATFIREVTTQFARGQTGRLWSSLIPAEQAIVTRDRYAACEGNEGFEVLRFKVLDTYAETVDVAGKRRPSTAVSVQVTTNDGVTTATMHAVSVHGAWRWILSPADYAAYAQGRCPKG